jgi:polyhydroxyalkanoate synthesis regulator phasin
MPAAKSSGNSRLAREEPKPKPAPASGSDGLAYVVEQLTNRVFTRLDLVVLTRERIQETMDDAAERGRVTRTDANELASELIRRGRQQRDDVWGEIEQILSRGRDQLGSATRRARQAEPVDRIVWGADRARRTVNLTTSFPISGYDELTARQVTARLSELAPAELRRVGEYERRHANRKSVLTAIEKALA